MKISRFFSLLMAGILLMTAIVPFAATPAAAAENSSLKTSISVSVENLTSSSYSCSLVAQTPADWTYMKPRQSFDTFWTVKNTGAVWHAKSTKFQYIYGTKMNTGANYFYLPHDVSRGSKIALGVDMIAPKYPGTYSTTWALFSGNTRVCRVYVIITVTR